MPCFQMPEIALADTYIWQAVQSNVESAGLLTDRVNAIMLVVLTSLKGKEGKDIPVDVRDNILRLTKYA